MATLTKTAALLALALAAGSAFAASKPATQKADTQTISTLGGKFTFNLPKAYVADTLPSGKAEDGTADTQGTLYANQTTKSVVIVCVAGLAAASTLPAVSARASSTAVLVIVAMKHSRDERNCGVFCQKIRNIVHL